MSNTAINTAQNVTIEFEYAGLGKRILAFLIDLVVIFVYFMFLSFTVYKAADLIDSNGVTGIVQLTFIPVLTYSLWTQILFNGRTLGKFAMGIKVIKENGAPVSWSDYLVKWIFRLIDLYLCTFTIGTISILFTDKKQTLGDRAAQTIVVNTRKDARVSHLILVDTEKEYTPEFLMVNMLNDSDMNEIKDIYRLAEASRDFRTLNALRQKIEQLLHIKSDLRDGPFVRTIMKDYSYLTER